MTLAEIAIWTIVVLTLVFLAVVGYLSGDVLVAAGLVLIGIGSFLVGYVTSSNL